MVGGRQDRIVDGIQGNAVEFSRDPFRPEVADRKKGIALLDDRGAQPRREALDPLVCGA